MRVQAVRGFADALVLGVLVAGATTSVVAQDDGPAIENAATVIRGLRAEGDYVAALEIAETELQLVQRTPETKPHEFGDAQRLVVTLQFIVDLPDSAQAALAEADRQDEEIEQVYLQGDYAGVVAMASSQLAVRDRWLNDRHELVAWTLSNRGAGERGLGDPTAALRSYQAAIDVYEEVVEAEHPELAMVLGNAAEAATYLGQTSLSLEYARRSYDIYRALYGNVHQFVAMSLNTWGAALTGAGHLAEAEPLFLEALFVLDEAGIPPVTGIHAGARQNLSAIYRGRGQMDLAIAEAEAGVEIFRRAYGDQHPYVGQGLANVAALQIEAGLDAEAETSLREALELLGGPGADPLQSVGARNNYAVLLLRQGRTDEAEALVQESLALLEATGPESGDVPFAHIRLAQVQLQRGDSEGANRELELARGLLDGSDAGHPSIPHVLMWQSEILMESGRFATAESTLVGAVARFERTRVRQGDAGLDRAAHLAVYDDLAVARLRLERPGPAWDAAERQLARALLDVLRHSGHRDLTDRERQRERSLIENLDNAEQALRALEREADGAKVSTAQVEQARKGQRRAESAWASFEREMANRYPLSEGRSVSREEVLQNLSDDEAILGWLDWTPTIGDTTSWAYVLRRDRDVTWVEVSADPTDIAALRNAIRNPTVGGASLTEALARRVWDQRVSPVRSTIEDAKRLIVVTSGEMLGVPVEALRDSDGRSLVDRFEISYTPSASVLSWLMQSSGRSEPGRTALLVGDPPFNDEDLEPSAITVQGTRGPDWHEEAARAAKERTPEALRRLPRLPGTRAEVEAIRQVIPDSAVLVREDASEQRLSALARADELRSYRVLHLATHGLIDDDVPDMSALVLSQVGLPDPLESVLEGAPIYDGLLTGREILRRWRLDADLVNLSACETGLGARLGGEGYVGLAHSLFQVGARSVIVSLWAADDVATSLLMGRFYQNWLGARDGQPQRKSDALREAKVWLSSLESDDISREIERMGGSTRGPVQAANALSGSSRLFENPYYWAPFVLIGDPGY